LEFQNLRIVDQAEIDESADELRDIFFEYLTCEGFIPAQEGRTGNMN